MSLEGKVSICLAAGGKPGVQVRSQRPLAVTRTLQGLPADQVADQVARLYALCGRAQRLAASLALEAAGVDSRCQATPLPVLAAAACLEALEELVWRFLVDLPAILGAPARLDQLVVARRLLRRWQAQVGQGVRTSEYAETASQVDRWLAEVLLGEPVTRFATQASLVDWLESGAPAAGSLRALVTRGLPVRAATALLPSEVDAGWLAEVAGQLQGVPEFARRPTWRGRAAETGALSRQQEHVWVAEAQQLGFSAAALRLLARLLDLVTLYQALVQGPGDSRDLAAWGRLRDGTGAGVGWVQSSRGLLLHRVVLDRQNARVVGYQTLAPTEWNFHPEGALVQELGAWPQVDPGALTGWVEAQAKALDPCVGIEIEVKHA